jgi:hypothetical protein
MFPPKTEVQFWLQWFTSDSNSNHWLGQWFLGDDGSKIATDGVMAVATRDETNQVPADIGSSRSPPKTVPKMMAAPAKKSVTISHEEAVQRFGTVGFVRCEECSGKAMKPHQCNCSFCEVEEEECGKCKDGNILEPRFASCWGKPFDANRIAYLFEHAPVAELCYVVESVEYDEVDLLRISTNRWSFILIAMNKAASEECPEVMENATSCAS